MKARYIFLLIIISVILFTNYNCKKTTTEPPVNPPVVLKDTLAISVFDVTHYSISLKISHTLNESKWNIKLNRIFNEIETVVGTYTLYGKDTTIIDDNYGNNLQLNTTYLYSFKKLDSLNQPKDTSQTVTAKTFDTTSFNYTWQEFIIGDDGSALYDVWGTDENNVYATGEINISGKTYGLLHFNGVNWTPIDSVGGYSIFGFSSTDIWIAGGGVFHYDGVKWKEMDSYRIGNQSFPLDTVLFDNPPYRSIWGTSSNNVYFASTWGRVIRWNGNKAELVYTKSGKTLKDIDGYSNDFIVATGTTMAGSSLTVYFDGNNWKDYPNIDNSRSLDALSIINKNKVYFAGDGIFEWNKNSFSKIVSTGYYVWDIEYNRQTGEIVASGVIDGLHIYNGKSWKSFKKQISNDNTFYYGIFLLPNKIFCVGSNDTRAKIIIGKK